MTQNSSKPSFFVLEQDPFVREDIEQILASSFPGRPIMALRDFEELGNLSDRAQSAVVAVVSANAASLDAMRTAARGLTERIGLVIVSEVQHVADDIELACHVVSRPFKSETMLNAVRIVLSRLPQDLP